MKKQFTALLMSFSLLVGGSVTVSADSLLGKENLNNIAEARAYITKSSSEIANNLENLKISKESVTLIEIQNVIENYYENNPAPLELANNNSISLEDVFPDESQKNQLNKGEIFSLDEFILQQQENKEVVSFSTDTTKTDVYVDKSGIFILHSEIEPNSAMRAATWSYTANERTTGTAYNALGFKMFDLWASGSFRYDGSKVEVAAKDGGYERKFWGSTLELTDRGMGLSRAVDLEGYKYAEVYSRLRTESTLGFRWFGLTLTDTTVEVKIGSTVNGNVYTGGGSI